MATLAELGGWPAVLGPLVARRDLSAEQAQAAMAEILEGAATPAQVAGFVVALRMKGESVDELTGMLTRDARGRRRSSPLPDDLRDQAVDIVGTGGDRSHTINVSTLASFVVAGAGVPVCKHGNRAASSSCGSADLWRCSASIWTSSPAAVVDCLDAAGMAFCFAPRFHPALRHAGPTRRELGIPTAFNMLGPMANPARVRRLVVGRGRPERWPSACSGCSATTAPRGSSWSTATTASTSSRPPRPPRCGSSTAARCAAPRSIRRRLGLARTSPERAARRRSGRQRPAGPGGAGRGARAAARRGAPERRRWARRRRPGRASWRRGSLWRRQ